MQFPGQGKPPVGIIFDANIGASIDTALALSLLYGFDGKNDVRVVSLSVSRNNIHAAAFCDAVGRFYAGVVSGQFGGFGRTLPVGFNDSGHKAEDTPMVTVPLAKRTADGKPVYDSSIHQLHDTAEPSALIRNALTSQYDQNAIVVLAGPATDLARVLDLPGVKQLIAQKVRFLSFAGGSYPDGAPDPDIQTDIPAAKRIFAEWPTPIVCAGREVGTALLYPAESIEKDFAWSPAHPVADAYRANKPMPYDAPTWAMTAILYAARPKEGYFKLSDPGTIRVLDDGRVKFSASAEGTHRYLISDPGQQARIVETYREVASAKPVVRQFKFRKKVDADAKAPEAKPAEPKPPEAKP